MLASLFRKARPESALDKLVVQLLRFEPAYFVHAVRNMYLSLEPAAVTMCVVAVKHLDVMLKVAKKATPAHPETPTSLDDFLLLLVKDGLPKNDIEQLRTLWFVYGLLAKRATALAESRESLREEVVDIWLRLAEGGKYLSAMIPESAIWDASEKLWFADLKCQSDGARFVVWVMCPDWVRLYPKISDFADANGFIS